MYGKITENKHVRLVLPVVVVVMNMVVRKCIMLSFFFIVTNSLTTCTSGPHGSKSISQYERHHTQGLKAFLSSVKTTLALVLNTAITPVLLRQFEMGDAMPSVLGISRRARRLFVTLVRYCRSWYMRHDAFPIYR